MEEVNTGGHDYLGWNSRMDTLQATFLTFSLKQLSKRIKSRVEAVNFYKSNIAMEKSK